MSLQPGARIGAYEIVSLLGAGGMGEVYRARDTRLQRDVAIKIVPESLAADATARARFETEARAVASLSHPNIIAIHDFGVEGTSLFAVMELLEGRTLREILADGPLPQRKATDYGAQIASGLAAAHARGVVHRDLKPENVFVTRDGRAKILDFGLAKPMAHLAANQGTLAATYTPTSPGTVLGTVGYMSPEQVRGEPVDHRTDIFSLGAILYECFSGKRAFSGPSAVETMNAILKEEPPELTISNLPPAVDRIIRRALEKDPAERFQSARDLGFALEALSGMTGVNTGAQAALPMRKVRSRVPLWAAAAGVLVIAVAGVAAGRWVGRAPAPPPLAFEAKTFEEQTIWNARFVGADKTIVFSASLDSLPPELFVSRPGAQAPQRLNQKNTHLLAVSSKGELAVLLNARNVGQRLFEGTLARMPIDGAPRSWMAHVREADWSPDGSTLAIIRDAGSSDALEYPIGTRIHTGAGYLSDVRVSPDGNHVAFMEHPGRYDDRGYVKVWDRGGSVRTVAGEYWGMETLAWSRDSRTIYFAAPSPASSVYDLRRVPADGSAPAEMVLPAPDSMYLMDIAADGTWLLTRNDIRASVRLRLAGEPREREASWLDTLWGPRLSADGSMLMFVDGSPSAGSNYAVAIRKTDGSPAVRLGEGGSAFLSPDAAHVLASLFNPSPRIVVYPTGAGDAITLSTAPLKSARPRGWVDNQHVALCDLADGDARRCYAQDLKGGAPTPLTPPGFITELAVPSPDGQFITAARTGEPLQLVSLHDQSVRPVPGLMPSDQMLGWSADGRSLLVGPGQAAMSIDRVEIATGHRTPLYQFEIASRPGIMGSVGTTVTADGRGYAYAYYQTMSRLFLVTGAKN